LLVILEVSSFSAASMLAVGANVVNVVITEIVMVRLQGDFAKPPEKRFNYKHCFDALFRVSRSINHLAWRLESAQAPKGMRGTADSRRS
jgi:hypothetical protein